MYNNMGEKEDLIENIKEYVAKAEESKIDSYNVAVTLYFKAIAVLIDLFIFEKEGYIPSNHQKNDGHLALKGEVWNSPSFLGFSKDYALKCVALTFENNERFRLLESKYLFLYKILDKDFPIYQRSYRTKLTKEYVEVLEDDFKEVVRFTGIKII
jgi:hypothetical protein